MGFKRMNAMLQQAAAASLYRTQSSNPPAYFSINLLISSMTQFSQNLLVPALTSNTNIESRNLQVEALV